jgi:hypothetical protein
MEILDCPKHHAGQKQIAWIQIQAVKIPEILESMQLTLFSISKTRYVSPAQFSKMADNFDIVLFSTDNIPASFQRFFTNSNYGISSTLNYFLDHIAIVLKIQEEPYLFESTSQEVGILFSIIYQGRSDI